MRKFCVALLTVGTAAFGWAGSASSFDNTPGRFTGGGKFLSSEGLRMTHGFELHCDVNDRPNNLEVNWEGGHHWHMTEMTFAACSDRDGIDPRPPVAPSDVHNGEGTGRYDGVDGYTAVWRIIDKGEPGTRDWMEIVISAPGGSIVIQTDPTTGDGTMLIGGNHQAHRNNR